MDPIAQAQMEVAGNHVVTNGRTDYPGTFAFHLASCVVGFQTSSVSGAALGVDRNAEEQPEDHWCQAQASHQCQRPNQITLTHQSLTDHLMARKLLHWSYSD